LFIVALRARRAWEVRRERQFRQQWRPLLMHAIVGDETPTALMSLPRHDQWRFLRLWNHLQESVRGEANQRLAAVAYHLGCRYTARRLLASGNLTRRLFAILTLGHMRDSTAWALLEFQLRQPIAISSLYAARALVQIDPERGVRTVMPLLLQRDDWEMVRIATLLQEFRDALGGELARHLASLPAERLPRALQLAEALHLHVPPDTLLPWLQVSQPVELLGAALRLANGRGVLPGVRALAAHADWRVRVQAAHALGRLGEEADVEVLTRLLSDPQWWVRYRAAGALANLPFLSRTRLRGLLESLPDRYAREISHQVFAELLDAYV
jgi:HEAT repeat protein